MLRGERIGLRARHESDHAVLMDELYNNVATRSRSDSRPWMPVPPEAKHSPYSVEDLPESLVCFSVVELETDELVGEALLWSLDAHNRLAHLGVSIRPRFRGRGLAGDIVQVLCYYGFVVRGLNRLQVDTLADNEAMIRTAQSVGFVVDGTLRKAAWVTGEFVDEVLLGLLREDWRPTGNADLS